MQWNNWDKHEPNNYKGQEDCTYLAFVHNQTEQSKFHDISCSEYTLPVCTSKVESKVKCHFQLMHLKFKLTFEVYSLRGVCSNIKDINVKFYLR